MGGQTSGGEGVVMVLLMHVRYISVLGKQGMCRWVRFLVKGIC